ncbi:hypothetical protein IAU60_006521 [Kwoniella sp. DSM 27419]
MPVRKRVAHVIRQPRVQVKIHIHQPIITPPCHTTSHACEHDSTMTYPDNSANSVHSLLALLRSAQDVPAAPQPSLTPPAATASTPQQTTTSRIPAPAQAHPSLPNKRQLDELLSSLNTPPARDTPPKGQLIEPFGPVGQSPGPSKLPYDASIQPRRDLTPERTLTTHDGANAAETQPGSFGRSVGDPPAKRKRPSERATEQGYAQMPFAKALPVLAELLADDSFKAELRKMKKDQDTLERRLWAKGEKVKADHERGIQAEKEVAKIARRPISSEKREAWAASLATAMTEFNAQQCLPAIDGLALRQRQRLVELGVPGLGSEHEGDKGKERVKRIIELLEAGLEES